MKALVLDFDGVISDSSREAYVIALRTWADLEPASRLPGSLPGLGPGQRLQAYDFAADPLFRAFRSLVPLGNRAEDFGVALRALEHDVAIPDQDSYDAFCGGQNPEWLERYHRRFYEHRAALRAEAPEVWRELQRPYPALLALLRRHAGQVPFAIATSKDGLSVRLLLEHYGVADLFPEGTVRDKDSGMSKLTHVQAIQEHLGIGFPDITFVDDRVNHLQRVAALGVRLVLAAWGHNTEREHGLARRLGLPVATLESAEAVIFGANGGH